MKYFKLILLLMILACDQKPDHETTALQSSTEVSKTHIEPLNGYSEAVVIEANGLKTIYISGQVGEGDTFESQFRDAISKLQKVLKQSGASFKDVVKVNTYIVDYSPDMLPVFRAVRKELLGDTEMPASTLIGVATLGLDSWKVEIDAVALIPSN